MREAPAIEAYGAGGFRIAGERLDGSVLILDDKAAPWRPTGLSDLTPGDFDRVIAAGRAAAEFVLLGMGAQMLPPPKAVREHLSAAGFGLEVMDTAAAVRLYNVLASDGRRVAAALIAV